MISASEARKRVETLNIDRPFTVDKLGLNWQWIQLQRAALKMDVTAIEIAEAIDSASEAMGWSIEAYSKLGTTQIEAGTYARIYSEALDGESFLRVLSGLKDILEDKGFSCTEIENFNFVASW